MLKVCSNGKCKQVGVLYQSSYCFECGKKLVTPESCSCGEILASFTKFCPNCGKAKK